MAVSLKTLQTKWEGSHPDNFTVVSLTALQAIKWCQAICCPECSAVHKTNTWSKVDGLYCDETLCTSGLLSHQEQIQALICKSYKIHSLAHVCIALLCHSLTHSYLLTWPLLVALDSAPWQLGGYHLRARFFAPPSGNTKQCYLATLNSATWQH